ncbi:type IV pilus twitching motility protein PilT [Desulforamulus aquiferis]|uniref:Type IV pilus twitching motility protein PilT n=1 Tax=Desulforamulus aquiferis TaxID=1397668 RepID=A0AAW7ZG11_9FIRM|nr:type IV pilus twitching motility protein PilT [Desulforamulus aquiferis]
MNIKELLVLALKYEASDIHISVGKPPCFRVNGELKFFDDPYIQRQWELLPEYAVFLTDEQIDLMLRDITCENQYDSFKSNLDIDFSYEMANGMRFRVNAYHQQGHPTIAIRLIRSEIYTLKELGLPLILESLAKKNGGLVLITGPAGNGKSSTLVTLIDYINENFSKHIITLEDPIEFVHNRKKSLINQREIGKDSHSFASALRAAMREDPDVILVGEMRDAETIATAITAAETGHLVFGTLHTLNASQTIERIIDVFWPQQQQQIRAQLANTLQGVVAQQLIPRIDGAGRVLAVEIMLATPAIRNLIREGKTFQLINQIQTGVKFGMQTLDMSLKELYKANVISLEEVLNRSLDPEAVQRNLG